MWVEAILSREDLAGALGELFPSRVVLGEDAYFELRELSEVALVDGVGLRVTCKAKLRWALLGIGVPITLHSLTVLLRPEIAKGPNGDELVVRASIDHADLAGVPDFLDSKIVDRVNRALEDRPIVWDFSTLFTRRIPLPPRVDPIDALDVSVGWGKVRVTEEAMVLAVSFHLRAARGAVPALVRPASAVALPARPSNAIGSSLLVASSIGFLTGAMLAVLWYRRLIA